MATPDPRLHRQARSIRNDERILDAATAITADEGWAGLLPSRVAERAGLSHPTVLARFTDRSAIGAAVWRERLAAPFVDKLQAVLEAAGLLGKGEPDAVQLGRAMQPFLEPNAAMSAAVELLVESYFNAEVRAAVADTLGTALSQWLTPVPRRLTRADAARRSFILITALGVLLESRRQPDQRYELSREWQRICDALQAPESIEKLPKVHYEHWDGIVDLDTGDALLDRLLEATREEIGRKGYEATTVDSIARAAGRTKGLVFSRYPSKRQLFNDAVDRYAKAMYNLNEQAWGEMLEVTSVGTAEAVLYREFMRPGREHINGFALEQYRLAWHDADMRHAVSDAMSEVIAGRIEAEPERPVDELRAQIFIDVAQGIGVLLMPVCYPDAWTLPYQHMTVPLNQ
jgi:AcrR family transcriptional regulator